MSTDAPWPLVATNDDGIRPAGEPDQCFYCQERVGSEHKRDCVIVTKKVRVRFTVELDVDIPHCWDRGLVEFQYNDSKWCARNLADLIDENGCICDTTNCEFIRVVDDTPVRKLVDIEA
jgi:hypothetical protein